MPTEVTHQKAENITGDRSRTVKCRYEQTRGAPRERKLYRLGEIGRDIDKQSAAAHSAPRRDMPKQLSAPAVASASVCGTESCTRPANSSRSANGPLALRNATMHTVAACGHFAEMEKPTEVAKLVIDFINAA